MQCYDQNRVNTNVLFGEVVLKQTANKSQLVRLSGPLITSGSSDLYLCKTDIFVHFSENVAWILKLGLSQWCDFRVGMSDPILVQIPKGYFLFCQASILILLPQQQQRKLASN